MRTIESMIRRFLGIDRLRMDVLRIEGRTSIGKHPLRVLYVHQPCEFLNYVENIAFNEAPKEDTLGSIRPWLADEMARRYDCDLALVFGWNAPFVNVIFRDYFFIPQWISAEVALEQDAVYSGNSPSRRRDIRKLAANSLSYRVTSDAADLEYFYNEMYSPTITAAHGSSAIIMPYEMMLERSLAGEAELVYIADAIQPIAGSLIVYDDGPPRLLSLGVLNACRDYYRAGVGSAIYLFSFQHLLGKGFDTVDIGRTRPFLKDGTLYFKRRMGMKVTAGTKHGFLMKPLNNSAGVRDFLCSSPFVYADKEQLRGVAFFQSDSEIQDAAAQEVPGLSRFETIDVRSDKYLSRLAS